MDRLDVAAKEAFEANETLMGHMMMNTPTDYMERMKSMLELAKAKKRAIGANARLQREMER